MTTYFAVLKKDFEYDDERYNPTDGGRPTKLFRSKEKAKEFVVEKTIEDFRKCVESNANSRWHSSFIPFDASYDYDIFGFRGESGRKTDEILRKFNLPNCDSEAEDFMDLTSKLGKLIDVMTSEELGTILGDLRYPLYEVYEVEADEEA